MSQTVMAARAYGLSVLDGTHNEIGDLESFSQACAQARAFGFEGKTLIHPLQITPCNRAFSPSLIPARSAIRRTRTVTPPSTCTFSRLTARAHHPIPGKPHTPRR
jgi:citrate lyase subunit beta/citryl-CoA lyase